MTGSVSRRQLAVMLGLAPLAGALGAAATPPRKWAEISPRDRIRDRHFPNVELVTQLGEKVRFYDDLIKDKLVVINFMYATCEGVCPKVMHNLGRVQKLLGDRVGRDIFLYSITLKPQLDTPEVLATYAEMHGLGPGWLLLTGAPGDVELLRRRLGFVDPDPEVDRDTSNHIGNVRYGNEPLTRWGSCPGMSDPQWIVESILWLDWPQQERDEKGARS
ncbi:MAG TPA: SCO family protein [Thermoanaerobaculia bacterium]|nr:SCO family protein [Thermoanaerobaculia bacterium]